MKGRILFTSVKDIENISSNEYDIKIQIVRSVTKGLCSGFKHVPHLSPSESLFKKTIYSWKKLKFTKEEKEKILKGKTKTWFDLYEEIFKKEASERKDFKLAYERIKHYLNNGKNIVAICYCEDFNRCHRSIIANMLIEEGYEVILN